MPRISAASNVVAFDSQTDVRVISIRRVDSGGNLASVDRVVNRPVAIVAARPRPSAPALSPGAFHADFAGARSPERTLSPHPSRSAHPLSFDLPAPTDDPRGAPPPYSPSQPNGAWDWDAPPPYSATDNTPHRPLPSAPGPDSPPPYSPPGFDWISRQGYPTTAV